MKTEFLPPGTYYVGDLCYFIKDEDWYSFLEDWDFKYEGVYGKFKKSEYWIAGTEYGDGCYFDQLGNSYGVDSGTIGCIHLKTKAEEERAAEIEGSLIIIATKPFVCSKDSDGTFHIRNLIIPTGAEPEEDDGPGDYFDEEE
jgi:hypothetical protein